MDTTVAIVAIIALAISISVVAIVAIFFGLRFVFKMNPQEVHSETKSKTPTPDNYKKEDRNREGL